MQQITAMPGAMLALGRQGENLARQVRFSLAAFRQLYGQGRAELAVQRKGDELPYLAPVTQEEDWCLWDVKGEDTALPGLGKCELRYLVDEVVVKTEVWQTFVAQAMGEALDMAPAQQKSWTQQVLEAGESALQSAQRAEMAAGRMPYVGENGNWFLWDVAAGAFADSGVSAAGSGEYVPSYVQEEAQKVCERANALQNGESFSFAAASDFHYPFGSGTQEGMKHLAQALNYIRNRVPLELFAGLGDWVVGGLDSTRAESVQALDQLNGVLGQAVRDIPNLRLNGNHDVLPYNADGLLSARELYTYIGRWNAQTEKDSANKLGNYGYLDFPQHKLRCIYLNTSDVEGCGVDAKGKACDHRISPQQYRWLIQALDLSGKEDCSHWGILLFGHFPLSWYGGTFTNAQGVTFDANPTHAVKVLDAYLSGGAASFTVDGESIACDFAGKNQAELIAYFHGHTHCFQTGTMGSYGLPRIAIPNACFGRENEYGQGGDVIYGEENTYPKTADSGEDTSFDIVTVDRKAKMIYCTNYGAGYDRAISYQREESGPSYTNQIPLSVNADGTDYVGDNGENGYNAGYRINSSGAQVSNAGTCVTGFMPVKGGDVVRFDGVEWPYDGAQSGNMKLVLYDAAHTKLLDAVLSNWSEDMKTALNAVYDASNNLVEVTIASNPYFDHQAVAWMRLAAQTIGASSVVTVNEEIVG